MISRKRILQELNASSMTILMIAFILVVVCLPPSRLFMGVLGGYAVMGFVFSDIWHRANATSLNGWKKSLDAWLASIEESKSIARQAFDEGRIQGFDEGLAASNMNKRTRTASTESRKLN